MKKVLMGVLVMIFIASAVSAQTQSGTISGTVYEVTSGGNVPLANAHIMAFRVNWPFPIGIGVWTDSSGAYDLTVPPGDFQVKAVAVDLTPEWYDGVYHRSEATVVTVLEDSTVTGIDFVLSSDAPPALGRITGHIYEDGTTNGICMASVTATRIDGNPFEKTVHSGRGGYYSINDLPAGSYVVTATKEGWSEGSYPDTILIDGDIHEDIDIYLQEIPVVLGSISGTITDAATSAPIEDAHVVVRGPGFWNYHHTTTGADGSYMVDQLEPGAYSVSAHKEDYYPGEYPDPVEIDGNDTTGIDIALVAIVPTGIRGTVTDISTGNPIEGARVHAFNVDYWLHNGVAYTDENGDYEINARPGEYRVRACAEGYLPEEYPTNVIVPEAGYIEDIDFALTGFSFGSISGTVTDTSGTPLNNAKIIAWKYGDFFGRSAWSDATGAYTIENLIPGEYRVHAHKWGFEPAVYPDTVAVPDGGSVPDIDFALIPLHAHDGVISGTVTDDSTGMPIEGASLIALGHTNGPWHRFIVHRAFTDADGNYVFDNLREIPFTILAHAQGYYGEFYDDVHSYFDATLVTPDADSIDIALTARENLGIRTIFGRISDPAGEFIDGGIVYLRSDDRIVDIVSADIEGYYGFTNLQPGIYEVSAFTPYGEGALDNPIELAFDDYGNADIVIALTSTDDNTDLLPEKSALSQNYPNPFNAHTTISFNLPSAAIVDLSIYNIAGQKLITLQDGHMNAGEHGIIWDGRSDNGSEVASGVYFYRLSTGDQTETRRMTFLK